VRVAAGEPRSNLEVVQQGYERFNRGDLEWVLRHLDPAIVWEDARQMPDARTYRGIDEVKRFLESFARHWEEIRFEPEELTDSGDAILAQVRMGGRGKASGAEVDARLVHVWEMRDLRVVRIRTFFDRTEAAAATGGPA
jgi:ketosteroid isomerase-like protein